MMETTAKGPRRQFGYVGKRGRSWVVSVELPLDPETSKRRRKTESYRTKTEAERRLLDLLHQVKQAGYVSPGKLTLGEYLQGWLNGHRVKARTLEGYRSIAEQHLIPTLGHIRLEDLRPEVLDRYYHDKESTGLSARSVLHHHRLLHTALEHAVKAGKLARNVAGAVRPPRPVNKEMRSLDESGVRAMLEAAKYTPYYETFFLAVFTGLRRSELLGLRWGDIDFGNKALSVVRVLLQLKDGRKIFEEPKTAKGRRRVSLPSQVLLVLRSLRERQEAALGLLGVDCLDSFPVFCRADGTPPNPDHVTQVFCRMMAKIGFPGIRFHDLRHTHASLMLKRGEHPKVVSERLGHANINITLDTYSHVLPGLQEAAARRFEELLDIPQSALPALTGV